MEQNVGDLDRAFRISLAIVLLFMGLLYNQTLLFIPAFILLLTGFLGVCPIYSLLGWNTKTYFDYPSVSLPQPPLAVEVEEKLTFPENEQKSTDEEKVIESREERRKELFEEPENDTVSPMVPVEEKNKTTKRRKRRNVRRRTKNKEEN